MAVKPTVPSSCAQDTPAAKMTYTANLTVPKPLVALMGANSTGQVDKGDRTTYSFAIDVWGLLRFQVSFVYKTVAWLLFSSSPHTVAGLHIFVYVCT